MTNFHIKTEKQNKNCVLQYIPIVFYAILYEIGRYLISYHVIVFMSQL